MAFCTIIGVMRKGVQVRRSPVKHPLLKRLQEVRLTAGITRSVNYFYIRVSSRVGEISDSRTFNGGMTLMPNRLTS